MKTRKKTIRWNTPAPTRNDFKQEGSDIMRRGSKACLTFNRRFRSHFGTTTSICVTIWEKTDPYNAIEYGRVEFKHLLWALMFMKIYTSENILASLAGCDEKTFRKWVWLFIDAIANLEYEVVSKNYILP